LDAWLFTADAEDLERPEFRPGRDGLLFSDEAISTPFPPQSIRFSRLGWRVATLIIGSKVKHHFESWNVYQPSEYCKLYG
jgi:hypothetical protein